MIYIITRMMPKNYILHLQTLKILEFYFNLPNKLEQKIFTKKCAYSFAQNQERYFLMQYGTFFL